MMKRLVLFLLPSVFLNFCFGQGETIESNRYAKAIKLQATQMGQLLLKGKYKSFAKFTYPVILEKMGGEKQTIAELEKGMQEMKLTGTTIVGVTIGEPSKVYSAGNEMQSVVSETLEMKVPKGKLVSVSYLIAISKDGGKNWFFIDAHGKDIDTLRILMPSLSPELIIPEDSNPVFTPDK